MPLDVIREPEGMGPPWERCCICREHTAYWLAIDGEVKGTSPALCESCAASNDECPTKEEWCRHERAARHVRP
jgi:hypothetical protein